MSVTITVTYDDPDDELQALAIAKGLPGYLPVALTLPVPPHVHVAATEQGCQI